jgi:hypothetical protein
MEIHWKVEGDNITFALRARTTGWVAIGLDPATAMDRADMVFGLVKGGTALVIDAWSIGPNGPHPEDAEEGGTYDILAYGGTEEGGWTTIEFTRKLSTGDQRDKDVPRDGKLKVIWAYGADDDWNTKHTRVGYATLDIGTGESESEEAKARWIIHAILMVTGTSMMLFAAWLLTQKQSERWKTKWFKGHITYMTVATAITGTGLVFGIIMVEQGTGIHLRVVHTWIGLVTLVVAFATFGSGKLFQKAKKNRKKVRNYHLWIGRAGLVLMVITMVLGVHQALWVA